MLHRYTHNDTQWIDLHNPTQEEVRGLMEEFTLDPQVAEELLAPTLKPQVDARDDAFYLVLHFPMFKKSGTVMERSTEIDFVVGEKWIITTRYEEVDPLHKFSKIFEVNSVLSKSDFGSSGPILLYYMLTHLYQSLTDELATVEDRLDDAEEAIFDERGREMVAELSYIGRDLLNLKQSLVPHSEVLESLKETMQTMFKGAYAPQFDSVEGDYYRLRTHISAQHESLAELRETNTSLVNTNQNEVMKVLTILAFVTFPLTLFTSLFGMNTVATPIVGADNDFYILLGFMLGATFLFFAYFKYKKWL